MSCCCFPIFIHGKVIKPIVIDPPPPVNPPPSNPTGTDDTTNNGGLSGNRGELVFITEQEGINNYYGNLVQGIYSQQGTSIANNVLSETIWLRDNNTANYVDWSGNLLPNLNTVVEKEVVNYKSRNTRDVISAPYDTVWRHYVHHNNRTSNDAGEVIVTTARRDGTSLIGVKAKITAANSYDIHKPLFVCEVYKTRQGYYFRFNPTNAVGVTIIELMQNPNMINSPLEGFYGILN